MALGIQCTSRILERKGMYTSLAVFQILIVIMYLHYENGKDIYTRQRRQYMETSTIAQEIVCERTNRVYLRNSTARFIYYYGDKIHC